MQKRSKAAVEGVGDGTSAQKLGTPWSGREEAGFYRLPLTIHLTWRGQGLKLVG